MKSTATEQSKAQANGPERVALDLWPDVGQALGLSRGATYAAARRGELPVLRIGKRIIVPRAAFQAFLDSAR
jgi:excisionase family DNA binding protein